jgi:hypothetical protein
MPRLELGTTIVWLIGMRAVLVCLLLPIAACSVHAFTPPARPMPLSPAQAPARGETDVQLDGNASGEIMGPGVFAGNLRVRRGVSEGVALVGDAGILRADGDPDGLDPRAATARVGVQVHGRANDIHVAVFGGAGGGHAPTAGSWASFDGGVVMSGTHRYVRPMFLVDMFVSEPFSTRTFPVGESMLRLPRTYGVQGLVGFDLGPRDRSLLLGFAVAQLWSRATDVSAGDSAGFFGLGGGFRFGAI